MNECMNPLFQKKLLNGWLFDYVTAAHDVDLPPEFQQYAVSQV